MVAAVIATHQDRDDTLPARIEAYLSRLNVASTYWPGDTEVRAALREEAAYRRFTRPRLRMMLEAVEDHLRGYTGGGTAAAGGRIARVGYHIEHPLPQKVDRALASRRARSGLTAPHTFTDSATSPS